MPRALDLFAGTHSFTRVAQQLGWECLSLDISDKHSPTICCDVLEWDYKQFPRGHFDFIWCSPPCQMLSIAPAHLYTAEQREERAQATIEVVKKMLEIFPKKNVGKIITPKIVVFLTVILFCSRLLLSGLS